MGESQVKENIAEICGAIIGDGWIENRERAIVIAGNPTEDKEYYDAHLSGLIEKTIKDKVKIRNFDYWKVYGIAIYKKDKIKEIIEYGLPKGKKAYTAKTPEWIISSKKKSIKAAFIRGLFDTDGCIFCQKDYSKYAKQFDSSHHSKIRIRISSISRSLIDQLFELCKSLDFNCKIRTIKRGFKNNRNCKDVQILEINELKSIKNWFKEIKPANQKHVTKYLIWTKFGFCPAYTSIEQRKQILKKKLNPYNFYKQG